MTPEEHRQQQHYIKEASRQLREALPGYKISAQVKDHAIAVAARRPIERQWCVIVVASHEEIRGENINRLIKTRVDAAIAARKD